MKTTQLNEVHRAAGAKLVDFAGWEMPLHYGSQLDEHRTVRTDAGMFDTSHMLAIDVQGEDAKEFLTWVLANNVERLTETGKALYSCMLAEDGGVIDDLIVYFLGDDFYRVIVNAGTAEGDLAWLEQLRVKKGAEVTLKSRRDLAMIAVQGPNAREKTFTALPELRDYAAGIGVFFGVQVGDTFVARTGYTGEDGFELLVPGNNAAAVWNKLAAAGVRPCGLGARDTLRLEAGMNLYGQDMDIKVTPLESGLAWTVDLKSPRDFVGKAALVSKPAARHSVGLVLPPKGGVLRAHMVVHTGHDGNEGDGEITSGTFSPTLDRSIALARVPRAVKVGDTVQVAIRDKKVDARVVKPPFARNGKALV